MANPELRRRWWGRTPRGSPAPSPTGTLDANGFVFGVAVGTITPMYPGCTAAGTPPRGRRRGRRPPASARRRCGAAGAPRARSVSPPSPTTRSAACWPRGAHPARQARSGATGTPATRGTSRATRARARQPSGASCADVRCSSRLTRSCDVPSAMFAQLASGAHVCAPPDSPLQAVHRVHGAPTSPTCAPQNTSSGSLTPTGPQTACCR